MSSGSVVTMRSRRAAAPTTTELPPSLGIASELLRRWKAAFEADGTEAFPGHGNLPPAEDEVRRLKAEVTRLKAERDILKKATALFARESL